MMAMLPLRVQRYPIHFSSDRSREAFLDIAGIEDDLCKGVAFISPTEVMCLSEDYSDAYMCIVTLPECGTRDGLPSMGQSCTVERIPAPQADANTDMWSFQVVGSEVYAIPDDCMSGGCIYVYIRKKQCWKRRRGFTHEGGVFEASDVFAIGDHLYVPIEGETLRESRLWRYTPEGSKWKALPLCPAIHDRDRSGSLSVTSVSKTSMHGFCCGGLYSYTPESVEEWVYLGEQPSREGARSRTYHSFTVGPYEICFPDMRDPSTGLDTPTVYDPISMEWMSGKRQLKALFGERDGAEYSTVIGSTLDMGNVYESFVRFVFDDSDECVYVSVLMVDASIAQNGGGGGFTSD
ncbi:hypothetical protein KIPB_008579 [Kipferlia bialata]|uniref:Uncharacterized protein n=1 Tax=Kipferlia bialata TaxID=797122 RepID=A0A9K3GLF2_9EUKA|nr:hypothetical protein KIPB_008579 [Kipferlia bialata]|eukprot:g8579.t1